VHYASLPILIGLTVSIAPNLRLYRTFVLDEINQDYVRTARAKGLGENRIMWVHVLRNASIPIITHVMAALPGLLIGAFLLERFFSIPGIGREVILAVERSDFPVIKALTVYVAVATMLVNLGADLMYKPSIRECNCDEHRHERHHAETRSRRRAPRNSAHGITRTLDARVAALAPGQGGDGLARRRRRLRAAHDPVGHGPRRTRLGARDRGELRASDVRRTGRRAARGNEGRRRTGGAHSRQHVQFDRRRSHRRGSCETANTRRCAGRSWQ
jgi:hypothetical protein